LLVRIYRGSNKCERRNIQFNLAGTSESETVNRRVCNWKRCQGPFKQTRRIY